MVYIPLKCGFDSSSCLSNFFCASISLTFSGGGIRLPFKCFGNVNMATDVTIIREDIKTKPEREKQVV